MEINVYDRGNGFLLLYEIKANIVFRKDIELHKNYLFHLDSGDISIRMYTSPRTFRILKRPTINNLITSLTLAEISNIPYLIDSEERKKLCTFKDINIDSLLDKIYNSYNYKTIFRKGISTSETIMLRSILHFLGDLPKISETFKIL